MSTWPHLNGHHLSQVPQLSGLAGRGGYDTPRARKEESVRAGISGCRAEDESPRQSQSAFGAVVSCVWRRIGFRSWSVISFKDGDVPLRTTACHGVPRRITALRKNHWNAATR
jgi:hypothetical protein